MVVAVRNGCCGGEGGGGTLRFAHLEKFSLNFSSWSFVIRVNLLQTILVPLWVIVTCLVFFYLRKLLSFGFLQFIGEFLRARGKNNSKCRD